MVRIVLCSAIIAAISQPTFAVVESMAYHATLSSEINEVRTQLCDQARVSESTGPRTVTELEDCGLSMSSEFSTENTNSIRLFDDAGTSYGLSKIISIRQGWGHHTASIATSVNLKSVGGKVAADTSMSVVERLQPPWEEFEGARLTLFVWTEGIENYSTARVRVFDHDTNELLLTWELGDDLTETETESDFMFSTQELNFEDRIGNAIRYELDVEGSLVRGSASFLGSAFLVVPEPASHSLFMLGLFGLVGSRKKRRSETSKRRTEAGSAETQLCGNRD